MDPSAGCYFSPTPLATTTQDGGVPDGCGNGGVVTGSVGGNRGRSPSLSIAPACGPKWCRSKLFGILGVLLMVGLAVVAALILHAECELPSSERLFYFSNCFRFLFCF